MITRPVSESRLATVLTVYCLLPVLIVPSRPLMSVVRNCSRATGSPSTDSSRVDVFPFKVPPGGACALPATYIIIGIPILAKGARGARP